MLQGIQHELQASNTLS